jgi:hypothetical protein
MSDQIDDTKKHGGGPKTPEGKRRSSQNATRHGLLANTVVLPCESEEHFLVLLDEYMHDFSPQSRIERDLVEELAATRWRLQRIWGMECTILQIGIKRSEQTLKAEFPGVAAGNLVSTLAFMEMSTTDRSLQLLHRYEARLSRRFHQIQTELRALAKERAQDDKSASCEPARPREKNLPNELRHPVLVTRRDDKTPPITGPAQPKNDKTPPLEDDAA